MNTHTLENELTYIKNITLFNSGNYAFFEEDFNQNIILEGNNNIGKTTILNSLQLLLLPEVNLRNFQNKFSISSGHNKKFTSKETYDFYFPAENSYIIVEVVNPYTTFCVILHRAGTKNANYEYTRVLVELPFSEIKKELVYKDAAGEPALITNNRKTFLNNLHNKVIKRQGETPCIYKEIKDTKDISSYLLSTRLEGRNNRYCIVPLKDTKQDTLQGFSTLFKSLYNVNNMDDSSRKVFVSNIIESRKVTDENRHILNFNLKETLEKNKELMVKKEYFTIMSNNKENFDTLNGLYDDFLREHQDLKIFVREIYEETILEIEELEKSKIEYNAMERAGKEKLEKLKEAKQTHVLRQSKLNENIAINNSKLDDINKRHKDAAFALVSFKEKNPLLSTPSNAEEILDTLFEASEKKEEIKLFIDTFSEHIEILKESIKTKEKEKETLMNMDVKRQNKDNIVQKIHNLKGKIAEYKRQLGELPFYKTGQFTEKEQIVMQSIFKNTILQNKIDKITPENIDRIKDFIRLFTLENNTITLDSININIDDFKDEGNEFKNLISNLQKELSEKEMELLTIEENLDENCEEKIVECKRDIAIRERKITEFEGHIQTLKNIDKTNQTLVEFEESNKNFDAELASIDEKILTVEQQTNKLKGEMEDQREIFKESFSTMKKLETCKADMEEYDTIEEYLFEDISDILLPENNVNEISDAPSAFDNYKKRLDHYKQNRLEIIGIVSKFVSNHIFENEVKQNVLDSFSKLSAEGQDNLMKLVVELKNKYAKLSEEQELLYSEIDSLNTEIVQTNGELLEMVKEIKKFRTEVNNHLEKIQISNLPGVSFDIDIDKKLLHLLENIEINDNGSKDALTNSTHFEKLSNYLFEKTKQNNTIKIIDLIEKVDYSIFEINPTTGQKIKTKNSQSNGTETMINLIFISILFKSIFKENRKLQLIVPLDEVSNVDFNNISTLLKTMKERDCKIVAASPIASPDHLSVFDRAVTIDKAIVRNTIVPKAQYIVLKNENKINIFNNEQIDF